MGKLIFILQGYEHQEPDGRLIDVVTVELVDKNTDNALKRAKSMIKKKFWRVNSIIEKGEK